MTPLLFLAIALAGGLGCVARFVLDGVIRGGIDRARAAAPARPSAQPASERRPRGWLAGALPWATILINVSGSFVLGLVTALTTASLLPEAVHLAVGTGFLGGYTTFSTASFETVRLLQARRPLAALANGLGVLVLATGAAALGLALGGLA